MTKIFRKIRQKLIEKGNLKNYLKYAIGEILLVMVGILLALQVNNWNLKRIDNNKEVKALTDLDKEFRLNAEKINKKQNSRIAIIPLFDEYVELIATGKADFMSFEKVHNSAFLFGMTNPSYGVIDALVSSGDISLISNDSLKYLLADWKNQLDNLYENEQILWDFGLEFARVSSNTIPDLRQNWSDWDSKRYQKAFDQLSTSINYRNHLIGFEGANKVVIDECNSILESLNNVLALLDKEINK